MKFVVLKQINFEVSFSLALACCNKYFSIIKLDVIPNANYTNIMQLIIYKVSIMLIFIFLCPYSLLSNL